MKTSNIVQIALIVAVAVLYGMELFDTDAAETQTVSATIDSTEVQEMPQSSKETVTVAYIDIDTLMANYQLAIENFDKLTTEKIRLEGSLEAKRKKLEREIEDYTVIASSKTQFENSIKKQEFMKKESELMEQSDVYTRKLMGMEQELTKEIHDAVNVFLDGYCQEHGYQIVLRHQEFTGVIQWGSKSNDITEDVIAALNKEYAPQASK